MKKDRHKIVPAVYILLIKDGKVLLIRRHNTGYMDGKYTPVAGHVEPNETFTKAAVRELKEEVNVYVKPEDLKTVHVLHRKGTDYERVDVFMTADKWEGEAMNTEPNKCDDMQWFDIENLPEDMLPNARHAINDIKNSVIYSERDWD